MERNWRRWVPFEGIHCPEAPNLLVIVARPVVIDTQITVELFSREEEALGSTSCGIYQVAEGVVIVRVSNTSCAAGEEPHRAVTVIAIEADCRCAADGLFFHDEVQAIAVRASYYATLEFLCDLGFSGHTVGVYEEIRRCPR